MADKKLDVDLTKIIISESAADLCLLNNNLVSKEYSSLFPEQSCLNTSYSPELNSILKNLRNSYKE